SRFAGDPNILGKSIRIGSISFSIVGVQNGMFRFPDPDVNLWVPDRIVQGRRSLRYIGVGRLKPNVTIDQARIDLRLRQAPPPGPESHHERGTRRGTAST